MQLRFPCSSSTSGIIKKQKTKHTESKTSHFSKNVTAVFNKARKIKRGCQDKSLFLKQNETFFKIWRKNVGTQHRDNTEAVGHLLISSLENPVNLAICEVFYKCHVPVVNRSPWESGCSILVVSMSSVWAGRPTGLSSEQHTNWAVPLSEPRGYLGSSAPALFTAGSYLRYLKIGLWGCHVGSCNLPIFEGQIANQPLLKCIRVQMAMVPNSCMAASLEIQLLGIIET